MARAKKTANLCEFGGCKQEARWIAHKLWGKGGTIRTCDEHKPGSRPLPNLPKPTRQWYQVEPIDPEATA